MELMRAIGERRSIRKYEARELPRDVISALLEAAMQAPSSKNRQPWRFVVVERDAKAGMLAAMEQGIAREEQGEAVLPGSARYVSGARHTLTIMEQAPVTIFILNPLSGAYDLPGTMEEQFYQLANTQSVGAAIQNMLLAATGLGLGALWNCDIYFAYRELCEWLGTNKQLVAAVCAGYAAEAPHPRPRNALADMVEWRQAGE